MTADTPSFAEPAPELRHRTIAAGEARVAVFRRTFAAPVEDVWDACTNPERLRRWYYPVRGDMRVGGRFEQGSMSAGTIERCEPPRLLVVSLGGGADELELRLSEAPGGGTDLELQHATTLAEHEIDGQMFDAIFCMGGGYYPRFIALDRHLRGELPADFDAEMFHLREDMRPAIDRGSAAMTALLESAGRG
jgi:uncharacterized protein YndB with AHSA1/START domain